MDTEMRLRLDASDVRRTTPPLDTRADSTATFLTCESRGGVGAFQKYPHKRTVGKDKRNSTRVNPWRRCASCRRPESVSARCLRDAASFIRRTASLEINGPCQTNR